MKRTVQPFVDYLYGMGCVSKIRQVKWYMIFLTTRPRTTKSKRLVLVGQHTPPLVGEFFDRGVPYASAHVGY